MSSAKNNLYIPNTTLKEDIRNITNNRNKIIAILKKDKNNLLYDNITYLKQNYGIADIIKNNEIANCIDLKELNSGNGSIQKRIEVFLQK